MTNTGSSRRYREKSLPALRSRGWLMAVALVAGLGLAALSGGCGEPMGGEDVEVARSAFSGFWYWPWGQQARAGNDLDLGPDTDRTCFVNGVGGNLKPHLVTTSGKTTIALGANIRVYQLNGHWFLTAHDATDAERVTAKAV